MSSLAQPPNIVRPPLKTPDLASALVIESPVYQFSPIGVTSLRPVCGVMHVHIDLDLRSESLIDFASSRPAKAEDLLKLQIRHPLGLHCCHYEPGRVQPDQPD